MKQLKHYALLLLDFLKRMKHEDRSINEICSFCTKRASEKLSRCGRCKIAKYCDKTCQKRAWPTHKVNCTSETPLPKKDPSIPSNMGPTSTLLEGPKSLMGKKFLLTNGRTVKLFSGATLRVPLSDLAPNLTIFFPANDFVPLVKEHSEGPLFVHTTIQHWLIFCERSRLKNTPMPYEIFLRQVYKSIEKTLQVEHRIHQSLLRGLPEAIQQWEDLEEDILTVLAHLYCTGEDVFALIPHTGEIDAVTAYGCKTWFVLKLNN